jgi:hypothetical protein
MVVSLDLSLDVMVRELTSGQVTIGELGSQLVKTCPQRGSLPPQRLDVGPLVIVQQLTSIGPGQPGDSDLRNPFLHRDGGAAYVSVVPGAAAIREHATSDVRLQTRDLGRHERLLLPENLAVLPCFPSAYPLDNLPGRDHVRRHV